MVFPHRFLIDECLSPRLAEVDAGSASVTHVNFRGLSEQSDAVIAAWCVEHDHILVTNNGRDFRRLYALIELHPGVVVILPSVERERQRALFAAVLPALAARHDLVNTLVEVELDGRLNFIDWSAA